MLDEALVKKLQEDEERQFRQQVELEEREKLWAQQILEDKSRQQ